MLSKAIAITAEAFIGKYDKGGSPYILHCIHVMRQVGNDLELQQIAVMHDLVEDTDYTIERLADLGFSDRVINGVNTLTHRKNESYDEYITRIIEGGADTIIVKKHDLRHNSDIMRMKGIRTKDHDRIEKYFKAYKRLEQYEVV